MDTVAKHSNAWELIGGHKGLEVYRAADVCIVKKALDLDNFKGIQNEIRMLRAMEDSEFVPSEVTGFANYAGGVNYTHQQDMGIDEGFQDGELFRRNCIRLLADLRSHEVRHGDCTSANLIIRDNVPYLIDWQESHRLSEPAPQKQPWTDSYMIWRTVAEMKSTVTGENDTPRVARRWLAVLQDQNAIRHNDDNPLPLKGKTLTDLGCFQGDFVAAAAVEGMVAMGVDRGGFRAGENSIEIARQHWSGIRDCRFKEENIVSSPLAKEYFACDIVLLFSVWPYVLNEYGWVEALSLLRRILDAQKPIGGVLYFESQYYGDGPGPEMFKCDADVSTFFAEELNAEATRLVTIPVTGRDAERTVWRVTG